MGWGLEESGMRFEGVTSALGAASLPSGLLPAGLGVVAWVAECLEVVGGVCAPFCEGDDVIDVPPVVAAVLASVAVPGSDCLFGRLGQWSVPGPSVAHGVPAFW